MPSELEKIPGVGPASRARLEKLGIRDLGDLLYHLPRRYVDRTRVTPTARVSDGAWVTVRGAIEKAAVRPARRRGLLVCEAVLRDDAGTLGIVWFFQGRYRRGRRPPVPVGASIVAWGTARAGPRGLALQNPGWERVPDGRAAPGRGGLAPLPVYPSTEGLSQKKLRDWIGWALDHALPHEPLSEEALRRTGLVPLPEAFRMVHRPGTLEEAEAGRRRLAFGELYAFQRRALATSFSKDSAGALPCPPERLTPEEFEGRLPFRLTDDQRAALETLSKGISRSTPMRRLLQGDVGSGKTVVAAYLCARAVLAGGQAVMMAPTRLLAEQHARTLSRLLGAWSVDVTLLTSGQTPSERKELADRLRKGDPVAVVGTHSVMGDDLSFPKLAVCVIDEQHRFGVAQREALPAKHPCHLLVMSATPIPRTMALVAYAGLEVVTLRQKPPGRRPVDTRWIHPRDREKVYGFLRRQAAEGCQAYVVFPRVAPDEDDEDAGLRAAEREMEALGRTWLKGVSAGLVHGQMRPEEQERVMERFVRGEIKVLIATTVIEVGVDVPTATVMVVEGAEQFGLSQLHQLRGRVGRGERPGYCLLIADPKTESAKVRIDALRKSDDGFAIAEMDLRLRGPGEFTGLRQAGPSEFRAVDFDRDAPLLDLARQEAKRAIAL